MKLFDYFTIDPANKNGLTITVKSEALAKFYYDTHAPLDTVDYDTETTRFNFMLHPIFEGFNNTSLRKAFKVVRMHKALSTLGYGEFTKESIPNLAFLSDKRIGNGITYTIENPVLKTEYQCFVKALEFYTMKLKTIIEKYYRQIEELENIGFQNIDIEQFRVQQPLTVQVPDMEMLRQ